MKINAIDRNEKTELASTRKTQYEKSMKYTRYIYIRYFIAVLLFSNVYWLASLLMQPTVVIIAPIVMICLVFIAYFHMLKLQSNPDAGGRRLVQFFQFHMLMTGFQIFAVWINCHFFFPYVQETLTNQCIMTIILSGSMALSFLSIKQLSRIEQNKDGISKRLAELKEYTL